MTRVFFHPISYWIIDTPTQNNASIKKLYKYKSLSDELPEMLNFLKIFNNCIRHLQRRAGSSSSLCRIFFCLSDQNKTWWQVCVEFHGLWELISSGGGLKVPGGRSEPKSPAWRHQSPRQHASEVQQRQTPSNCLPPRAPAHWYLLTSHDWSETKPHVCPIAACKAEAEGTKIESLQVGGRVRIKFI